MVHFTTFGRKEGNNPANLKHFSRFSVVRAFILPSDLKQKRRRYNSLDFKPIVVWIGISECCARDCSGSLQSDTL